MAPLLLVLALVLAHPAAGSPYGSLEDLYSPDYTDEDGEAGHTPQFVSRGLTVAVEEGETVRLPCIVDRLQGFVLMWKRNGEIVTVGDQVLGRADPRYVLHQEENGNSLEIARAHSGDEGEWVCQVSALQPSLVSHSLQIRVHPVLLTKPDTALTVAEGEQAVLECSLAAGSPRPELGWRRRGGRLADGVALHRSPRLVLAALTRQQAGTYECLTLTGEPVTRPVTLTVQYAPVIEAEQSLLRVAGAEEIHLSCSVSAWPPAVLTWLKEGREVKAGTGPGGRVHTSSSGHRYNLILPGTKHSHALTLPDAGLDVTAGTAASEQHYGEYSCVASNAVGRAQADMSLSAYAEEAMIRSEPVMAAPHTLEVEWTARSDTPVTIFRAQFMAGGERDWREVDVTASRLDSGAWHGRALLPGLQPNTGYQVRVSSLNSEGYSKFSRPVNFTTPERGNFQQADLVSTTTSGTGSGFLQPGMLLLAGVLLLLN